MSKPMPTVREKSDASRERIARPGQADDAKRWREENADAIRSINDWVEKNGLPLVYPRLPMSPI